MSQKQPNKADVQHSYIRIILDFLPAYQSTTH